MNKTNYLILLADIALFIILLQTLPFEKNITLGLSILVFIGILWLTEAIHITVTAILVPILAVVFHIYSTKSALSHFANPVIFQFLGGFSLATALRKQEIDKAIAEKILRLSRGKMLYAFLMLFLLTAGLSMWISNTATTSMMLPIVLGVLQSVSSQKEHGTYRFVLLGIAYCASIGGMATLIGTAPNAIAASQVNLNFDGWLYYGLPISLLLLPIVIGLLFLIMRPNLKHNFTCNNEAIIWNKNKIMTLGIFALTVTLWLFSRPISHALGDIKSFDALVGLFAVVLVSVSGVAKWSDIQKRTEWGVLILLGSGICLSSVLQQTGTSEFLAGNILNWIANIPLYLAFLLVTLFVVFLTEFASNTATAALLIPVFATVAVQLNISPITISVLVGIATSCAFMLPAATPPNALVYSTGFVPQKSMIKTGVVLNITVSLVLSSFAFFVW